MSKNNYRLIIKNPRKPLDTRRIELSPNECIEVERADGSTVGTFFRGYEMDWWAAVNKRNCRMGSFATNPDGSFEIDICNKDEYEVVRTDRGICNEQK